MRTNRLLPAVLAAAILAGQWLAAAHGGEPAASHAMHGCAVCVYAGNLDAGAAPAPVAETDAPRTEAPELPAATQPAAIARRHHPIRGPPILPA